MAAKVRWGVWFLGDCLMDPCWCVDVTRQGPASFSKRESAEKLCEAFRAEFPSSKYDVRIVEGRS